MFGMNRKARVFWPIFLLLVLVDCSSKSVAVDQLVPRGYASVADGIVRFTLAYNRDAAMGLSLGPFSRIGFALAAVVGLIVMMSVYRQALARDTWKIVALALVSGGATGNLLDRLRSARGVVDFIDVGIGAHRFWWLFNVADVGISVGAVLLAISLWRDKRGDAGNISAEVSHR
jgi:signal peptidase II